MKILEEIKIDSQILWLSVISILTLILGWQQFTADSARYDLYYPAWFLSALASGTGIYLSKKELTKK